ncbi:unnamed protein product [Heligmosomoides polygyrus]|uniref:CBF domain-containing protein n=1 Tax=Heligmosomoides polygyrus TaxID=6339 RepID=A0A183FZ12_HELPZ|nr:unnamed protein product [Heligmosomoides polygyrus]
MKSCILLKFPELYVPPFPIREISNVFTVLLDAFLTFPSFQVKVRHFFKFLSYFNPLRISASVLEPALLSYLCRHLLISSCSIVGSEQFYGLATSPEGKELPLGANELSAFLGRFPADREFRSGVFVAPHICQGFEMD